jgi:hypothetical protein
MLIGTSNINLYYFLKTMLETLVSPELSRERVEEKILHLLEIEILDLEDYSNDCIPEGYVRYQVYRSGRSLCPISRMGGRYYTRAAKDRAGYASLYEAATFWVDRSRLTNLESAAQQELEENDRLIPDYM